MKRLLIWLILSIGATVHGDVALELKSGGIVSLFFTLADYNANGLGQKTAPAASTLIVDKSQGGGSYGLYARALTDSFSLSPDFPGDSFVKPCSDLALKRSTSATFIPLTTSDQLLVTAAAAVTTVVVDYQLRSDLNVEVAGRYSLTVVFTVTQP